MTYESFRYGRTLEDFETGASYAHPWQVTIDGGTLAFFQASFQDATPVYAANEYAQALGFKTRPVPPLLLLNLGLSFSVHDVSEQAIAHLAYLDVKFPQPCYLGDTVTASSKVLGKKATSSGDKGVVHVRTLVSNQEGDVVCVFERKALVRAGGKLKGRPEPLPSPAQPDLQDLDPTPLNLRSGKITTLPNVGGFAGFYDDLEIGRTFCHYVGKTIGDTEHMQLTSLVRNSHPLHFDENYCKEGNSFSGGRVVYGGLVFGWIAALASRDTTGNVLWDLGFDQGAHPSGVAAGDTLYAASKVLAREDVDAHTGRVTIRLVGTKNQRPDSLLDDGAALFDPELKKDKGDKIPNKVFEITRTFLVRKKPA